MTATSPERPVSVALRRQRDRCGALRFDTGGSRHLPVAWWSAAASARSCRTYHDWKLTEAGESVSVTVVTGIACLWAASVMRATSGVQQAPKEGVSPAGQKLDAYGFADFDRRSAMLWLALAFGVLLIAVGRLRALRALIGLAASLVLVIEFVIPAILHGRPQSRSRSSVPSPSCS